MKKTLILFLIVTLTITSLVSYPAYAASTPIKILVGGEVLGLKDSPYQDKAYVMVPVRAVAESLDAYVTYDGKTRQTIVTKGNTSVRLKNEVRTAYVNNRAVSMETAPKLQKGVLFVPLRFLCEAIGVKVDWVDRTKTVILTQADTVEKRGNTSGNISNFGYAALDGEWAYVSLWNAGLVKIKQDSTEKVKLLDDPVSSLNISGDWIYYVNFADASDADESRLYRMKRDGSGKQPLTTCKVSYVSVAGQWVYYLNQDDDNKPYKMRLNGEEDKKISDTSMESMIVEEGWIYFLSADDGVLQKMRITGSDVRKLTDQTNTYTTIVKNGDWIYFDQYEEGIWKIKTDGTSLQNILETEVVNFNYADGWFYYNDVSGNLYKTREGTEDEQKIEINQDGFLNVAADWIYYTEYVYNSDTFKEYRVKTDGSIKQRLDTKGPLEDIDVAGLRNYTPVPKPIVLPVETRQTVALTPKEIARQKNTVAFIKTYDEDGEQIATGSGFNIESSGIVVTNYHVIQGASSIKCSLNEASYEVDYILNYDYSKDIAILKLKDGANLPAVKLGDSDRIELAEDVVAIGNPMEMQNTVSTGIVSGLRSNLGIHYIQTTAPISAGSSGGPLFNIYGEVIGMTSLTALEAQNLNLAVPVNSIRKLFSTAAVTPVPNLLYQEMSIQESEPNDIQEKADSFKTIQGIEAMLDDEQDADTYKFTLAEKTRLSVYALSEAFDKAELADALVLTVSGQDGRELASSTKISGNEVMMQSTLTEVYLQKLETELGAGTYYLTAKWKNAPKSADEGIEYMLWTITD